MGGQIRTTAPMILNDSADPPRRTDSISTILGVLESYAADSLFFLVRRLHLLPVFGCCTESTALRSPLTPRPLLQMLLYAKNCRSNSARIVTACSSKTQFGIIEHFPEEFFTYQMDIVRKPVANRGDSETGAVADSYIQSRCRSVNNLPPSVPA